MRLSSLLVSSAIFASTMVNSVQGCGRWEFYEWWDLPTEVREAAMALGYDFGTWTNIRTNPIEYVAFPNLAKAAVTKVGLFQPRGMEDEALIDLDLLNDKLEKVGVCWDFNINHYTGYTWDEIQEIENPFGENIGMLAVMLGWDEESWDASIEDIMTEDMNDEIPEGECLFWWQLSPDEKYALRGMGWTMTKWDSAPCDPRCGETLACSADGVPLSLLSQLLI